MCYFTLVRVSKSPQTSQNSFKPELHTDLNRKQPLLKRMNSWIHLNLLFCLAGFSVSVPVFHIILCHDFQLWVVTVKKNWSDRIKHSGIQTCNMFSFCFYTMWQAGGFQFRIFGVWCFFPLGFPIHPKMPKFQNVLGTQCWPEGRAGKVKKPKAVLVHTPTCAKHLHPEHCSSAVPRAGEISCWDTQGTPRAACQECWELCWPCLCLSTHTPQERFLGGLRKLYSRIFFFDILQSNVFCQTKAFLLIFLYIKVWFPLEIWGADNSTTAAGSGFTE